MLRLRPSVARDTVLGFDDPLPYEDGTSPSCGAIVGRVANRIANAQFELDGVVYHLDQNNGNNTLHGGFIGFGRRLWKHEGFVTEKGASARFTYHSLDDEEGFPGTLDVVTTYTVLKSGEFTVEMTATAGGNSTPVNLVNHTYWNLAGHDSGDVREHWVVLNADSYTPTDSELIPTGKIDPVAGTPLDFTNEHQIGDTIDEAGGYDNNYVINKHKKPLDGKWPGLLEDVKDVVLAVEVSSPAKDLSLEIYTNAPGVQFYTASPDPAAAAATAAAAASGGAGTSGTVAAPGPDPAMAGPGGNFAYIDRKAAQIPSKYDGKDDVESWINSMWSYFDVLGTPPSTQSSILGTNVEPVVRGFLETQAVQLGYKRIDLNKWLKAMPTTALEDLLIKQYADPHAAAKARVKLDKLKHSKWTDTMHSLQQYVSKIFATPDLEMTAQSCLDVIKDPKLTFVVTTDASLYGIGAVLQQDDGDGLRPLEFYSKHMPIHKVAASTYMRELYALREALDHWKHYLLGRHFKVFSDHETLKWIQTEVNPSTTLTRWLHEIDVYDFELKHKKGCYNRVADALSRHPEYMTCLVGSYDLRKNLKEELIEHTAKDPELSPILEQIRADPSSQPDFHECKGLLFRRYGKHDRLCVPNHEPIMTHFLDLAHGRSGHFGVEKTYGNLLEKFVWPGMKRMAQRFVAECEVCQRIKPSRQKPYGLLHPLPIPDGPGESVSIDFTDMGKKSRNGYSQVMVIVDRFSKFLNLIPLPPHAPIDLVIDEFNKRYAVAFAEFYSVPSAQDFPNAINQPNFPSSVLRPGEVYVHAMLCRWGKEGRGGEGQKFEWSPLWQFLAELVRISFKNLVLEMLMVVVFHLRRTDPT
ncbi:hypothetical protein CBR_g49415 [Chara braunii]|uniref:Integrase catalytic domain-containing protein n=1 Tax=Chara braunii TaxID=69332 RepID=A0A388M538_CHABU|nr:hypothetical protein CBR_g49415 [Chara braunii]|eukprot:GBG89625.1 hypothetical protein CBR_g49415 [Chara braunii]